MKNTLVVSVTILLTTLAACSNYPKEEKKTSITNAQQTSIDSNTAKAAIAKADLTVLPTFNLQDKDGRMVNLQSFKGKKIFVNLWASWCPPCRAEIPSIQKLTQTVDTGKVAFVMVSLDDNFEKAKQFVNSQKIALPIYYPAENLPDLFNVQGIPSTFIFDESGKLVHRVDGGDNYDTEAYQSLLK